MPSSVVFMFICVADLKESVEYLSKKYGDKEKDHVTLVRAFSSAAEKVHTHYTSTAANLIIFQVAEMEKEKEDNMLVEKGTFERLQKGSYWNKGTATVFCM